MKSIQKPQQEDTDNVTQKPAEEGTGEDLVPFLGAIAGMIGVGLLYFALPPNVIFGPNWLLLVIEVVFLIPEIISVVSERKLSHTIRRIIVLILLGINTLALGLGVALLIYSLPTDRHATNLLRSAVILWCLNILIFALWYWEVDGEGPWKRQLSGHQAADFMFPHQVNGNSWAPHFLDYLFLAFCTSTALSPADTFPLTRPAKVLMMIQASLSMIMIGLLVARAVNILGS